MKPGKCPVCKGKGKTEIPTPGTAGNVTSKTVLKRCHGCNGKGWVEVKEDLRKVME